MRFLLIFSTFLYANVANILTMLDEIDSKKLPKVKISKYNIFTKRAIKRVVIINPKKITKKDVSINVAAVFNKMVLIDGKWYKEGEMVKGFKILKVYPKKIVIKADKIYTIEVSHPRIRIFDEKDN